MKRCIWAWSTMLCRTQNLTRACKKLLNSFRTSARRRYALPRKLCTLGTRFTSTRDWRGQSRSISTNLSRPKTRAKVSRRGCKNALPTGKGNSLDFEIRPEDVKQKLDTGEQFTLLDVREPWEVQT